MRTLKQEIAIQLGFSVEQFRIRKNTRGKELKDQNKTLEEYRLLDKSIVYLEFGVPAKPNEISLIFRLYDPEKKLTDPLRGKKSFCDLIEFPFPKDMTVAQLKEAVVEVLDNEHPAKDGNSFGIKFARIRKLKGARIGEILYDANKLRQYNFQDGTKLAIQRIVTPETFSRKHLSLFFLHYRADHLPYGKLSNTKEEMVIEKTASVEELKALIMKRYDIELENILIERGRMTSVMTAQSVYAMKWHEVANILRISESPLMLRNGMIVIFQDKTVQLSEEVKERLEEEKKAKANKRRNRLKRNPNYKAGDTSRVRRAEPALIIRTESEVFAAEKAEQEKKENAAELVELKEPEEEETVKDVEANVKTSNSEATEKPAAEVKEA